MSETILSDPAWEDPALCPTCDRAGDASLLDHVRYKLAAFDTVEQTSKAVSDAWSTKGWNQLDALENLARLPEEPAALALARSSGAEGRLSAETARALTEWVELLVARANAKVEALGQAKVALERSLPEKLTAVVEKAEAARRLQTNLRDLRTANNELEAVSAELARIARVKAFLDTACSAFATAESNAGARRLAAIEPATRSIFAAIMFSDVVPALKKRAGSEDLLISLANFWSLTDVSAQAVLSESYRNAFAISVYLAAALNSP